MNFKQRNLYVHFGGPMGEYPLKLCFYLFTTKTFAMLLIFLHMHGSPCIWALQSINVKARVTIVNL